MKFFNSNKTLRPPYAAFFMGCVLALSLIWLQKGLHVSGAFAFLCSTDNLVLADPAINLFCSPQSLNSNNRWILWMTAGVFFGGFLSSLARTKVFHLQIEIGKHVHSSTRFKLVSSGGFLVGIGAALAGGCTSSIGLTGAAMLSVGSYLFLILFFVGGFVARFFFGRFWYE